jgi:DNA-binding MarR family transcriptional regulator
VSEESGAVPDTSLLFDVFALSQAVGRLLADAMRDGPLTPSEYAVSSAIFELEAASPTELAGRLGMRLTTFMDQLRAFERRRLARRIAHPTDRRSYRVVLTGEGLAAHRAANQVYESGAQAFEAALGDRYPDARSALRDLRAAAASARAVVAAAESPDGTTPAALTRATVAASTRPSAGRAG